MSFIASVKVWVKRRRKCSYCGAPFVYETPTVVKGEAWTEEGARQAVARRFDKIKSAEIDCRAPCPSCGRFQKNAQASRLSRGGTAATAGWILCAVSALWADNIATRPETAFSVFDGCLAILGVVGALFFWGGGIFALYNLNRNPTETLKKFPRRYYRVQTVDGETKAREVFIVDSAGKVVEVATSTTSALRRESRAKARTALATLLAGAALLLISTAFVGDRFKALDALKRYDSSLSVRLDLGVRGESIFGYWRVESQNLRAYLADGGEEVAVRVVPIGAKTFGWGPFIIERRSDITESATEAFRVVAEVRLPENRALAGRELRLKGEVELEFPTELEEEWRLAVVDNFIDVKKTAKVDVPFKLPKDFADRVGRSERAEAAKKYVVAWRCGFVAAFWALTTAVALISVETRRAEKDAEKNRSVVVSVAPETERPRWGK